MNPLQNMMPGMGPQGPNLFSIILNIIFGFVIGLIVFLGFKDVIAYGTELAGNLLKLTGYGQQMSQFGFATTALPYVVLAPIAGLVVKELSSIRTLKGFGYFVLAVLAGFIIAYFSQGYFASVIHAIK
jgi:hypothetical protein